MSHRPPKYDIFEKLGQGTYGGVYKGRSFDTGEFVALKKIQLDQMEGMPATAMREVALLKALGGHRNIMSIVDVEHEEHELTLVFELCKEDLRKCIESFRVSLPASGSALGFIGDRLAGAVGVNGGGDGDGGGLPASRSSSRSLHTAPGPLPPSLACDLMRQMLSGVAFMHDHKIIHRDLKPQNVLLTHDGVLKLADFGLARKFGVPVAHYSSEIITLWYRPLDVLLKSRNYGPEIDIWSVGCIFAEMLSGRPFFRGRSAEDQILTIFKTTGTPDEGLMAKIVYQSQIERNVDFPRYPRRDFSDLLPHASVQAIDLLEKLLELDLDVRFSARQALREPYLSTSNAPEHSVSANMYGTDKGSRRNAYHGSSHR